MSCGLFQEGGPVVELQVEHKVHVLGVYKNLTLILCPSLADGVVWLLCCHHVTKGWDFGIRQL